jgi:uncharacterized protein YecE (DUF72 family)
VYARLHSGNAANWYAGHGARYDYDFPEMALREWADHLERAASDGVEQATVYFNNCYTTQAVDNAKRLAELMSERPGVELARPTVEQRGLFDAFA